MSSEPTPNNTTAPAASKPPAKRRMGGPKRSGKKQKPGESFPTDGVLEIIHVRTADVTTQGVVLSTSGIGEKHMTQPFFHRDNPTNAAFLNDAGCVLKVFKLSDSKGDAILNSRGWPRQGLVFGADGDSYSKEEVIESVRDIFLPAYEKLDTDYPLVINDSSYREVETWTETLLPAEVKQMYKWTFIPANSTFREFVTCDMDRLYSVYKAGSMSRKEIKSLRLKAQHMVVEDAAKLQDMSNDDPFAEAPQEALELAKKNKKDRDDAAAAKLADEKAKKEKETADAEAAKKKAALVLATAKTLAEQAENIDKASANDGDTADPKQTTDSATTSATKKTSDNTNVEVEKAGIPMYVDGLAVDTEGQPGKFLFSFQTV